MVEIAAGHPRGRDKNRLQHLRHSSGGMTCGPCYLDEGFIEGTCRKLIRRSGFCMLYGSAVSSDVCFGFESFFTRSHWRSSSTVCMRHESCLR